MESWQKALDTRASSRRKPSGCPRNPGRRIRRRHRRRYPWRFAWRYRWYCRWNGVGAFRLLGEVDMKTSRAPWFRTGVATLVFATLLTFADFMIYGGSTLLTARGILGIIIQTGMFFAVMICAIRTVVNRPDEASDNSKEHTCDGITPDAS